MALLCSSVYVYFFILAQLSVLVLSLHHDKPQIDTKLTETIINSGENYTVLCEGNTPLKWKWPEIDPESPHYDVSKTTRITYTDVTSKSHNNTHASRLFVANATYPYTGFYTCYGENIDPSDEEHTSKIYLYVRDEEHLSVKNEQVDVVVVAQYSEAVIPCRPTSPDVDVEFALISGQKPLLGIADEEGVMYRYSPYKGFITNNTRQPQQILYTCTFKRGNLTYDTTTILEVEPLIYSLPKPILEEVDGGHTVVGETLVLQCKIKAINYVVPKWSTPTGPPDLSRMHLSGPKLNNESFVTETLTINKTILEDKGTYQCTFKDNQNHSNQVSLNVTIYDKLGTD